MKHSFTVVEELDTTVAIAVGAYLDCEHYMFLHKNLSGTVEIAKVEGRKVTVKQGWKWMGMQMGHFKTGEYVPPARFLIYDVVPANKWIPSIHHLIGIKTDLRYKTHPERNTCMMTFDVELTMPFFLYPFRKILQRMIEKMHAQQNAEDMACLKYRAAMFGRENNSAYLAPHQFLYHKDDYARSFGQQSKELA